MIGIYKLPTGELVEVVKSLDGVDLADRGYCARPAAWSVESWSWSTTARQWLEDIGKVETALITQVDRRREAIHAAVMTQGVGQSYAYTQKAGEVHDYRNVVGSLLESLTETQRAARFPFAMAEATATGDSLATIIARFEAGMAASRMMIAQVEAAAVAGKRAIRAAATVSAKQAAFAAINWN